MLWLVVLQHLNMVGGIRNMLSASTSGWPAVVPAAETRQEAFSGRIERPERVPGSPRPVTTGIEEGGGRRDPVSWASGSWGFARC